MAFWRVVFLNVEASFSHSSSRCWTCWKPSPLGLISEISSPPDIDIIWRLIIIYWLYTGYNMTNYLYTFPWLIYYDMLVIVTQERGGNPY